MPELSIMDMLQNTINTLANSKVVVLFILEFIVLMLNLIFKNLMNEKVVKKTTIITSLLVLGFYISNYVDTVLTFMNNVSTRFMEFLYFPTTLEYIAVMIISLIIMGMTLKNKKAGKLIKVVNTLVPVIISFLFLGIIEFTNTSGIDFDEFSVFTDPTMMSLYELAMIMFVLWIIGLVIYKVDMIIINKTSVSVSDNNTDSLVTVTLPQLKDDIEMPKLKVKNI